MTAQELSIPEQAKTGRPSSNESLPYLVDYLVRLPLPELEIIVSRLAAALVAQRKDALLCCDAGDDPQATACVLPITEYLRLRQSPEQTKELRSAIQKAAGLRASAAAG